ncbi:flagellar hook-basal body complex protein [Nocardioides sp.]|jgi:flagellar hook protein FlgE|uniref:flagellar hook-basal body complex protein n=1 Tax=Nocardioides sp. TaxID=35761 RepID=UPI002639E582|nr:flagellar hook-basal body complex protein [Nocardioides sp.]
MLRSLFAGISGLRVNQTMLDVTGNNIANANTTGFKSSSTVFQDTLSQMLTAGSNPTATSGGTNPIQIGLGVQLAATAGNFTQGANQTTGRPTDMMINGDGFFILGSGDVAAGGAAPTLTYTRAGSFSWDKTGNLVAPDGSFVMGYAVTGYTYTTDPATGTITSQATYDTSQLVNLKQVGTVAAEPGPGNATLTSYEIGSDGVIRGVYDDGIRRDMGQVALATFTNPQGLNKVGDTQFAEAANSGAAQIGAPGSAGHGDLTVGSVEMSNVDLAQEFTNLILAQRGFEASSKVITTSDQVLETLVNIKR